MIYFFITLDAQGCYVSHVEGDNYRTWKHPVVRCKSLPDLVDGMFYKYNGGESWIELSEYPTALPTPEPIPQSITPRQIRLQLTAMGLRQQVEDWVATQPLATKDWWEFSLSYERNNQMLIDAAAHFGLTSEQLDQLFIEASKL